MKLFRNLLFFAAAFIMIGHDIVPHIDAGDVSSTSKIVTQQVAHEHLELGHIFEHFQHSSNERTSKYVTGAFKNLNVKTKILQNSALIVDIDNQFIWHANFEKQRFRDYPIIPYYSLLSSQTPRGPPSC
ncbi:hypothetical protein [Gillisia sp. JM1]|uniref:hypothetical protein n=1 Tax=Gillisia sp. JM1 TaxID=1283286 RepID=UPI001E39EC93|nr:hypothetical protein [Gillisia sp. JM1]